MIPERCVLTTGVYGFSEDEFFARLVNAQVDVLMDIRARRGMRGSEYAFVNSARLQARLKELGIAYLHVKALAPTEAMRGRQKQADAAGKQAKRTRAHLSDAFAHEYRAEILTGFDWPALVMALPPDWRRLCLFCVEREPTACHRSLAAPALAEQLGVMVEHLT